MKSKSVQRGALTTTKKNTRLPSRCFSPPSLPAPLSPGSGRDPATGTGRGTAKPPPAAFPRTHPDPPATSPRRNGGAERGTPPAGKRSPGPPCPRGPPADKGGRRDRGGAPRERLSAPPRAAPRPRAKSASALPSAPRSPGCPHPRAPPAEHPARPARFFFRPTPQSASTPTRHPRVVHAAQSIIPPTPPKKKIKKIPRPTAPTLPALSVPTANRTNRALLAPHPPAAPSRPPGAGRPRRGAGPEHVSRTRETKERGAGSSARQRTAAEDPRRIAEREERGRRRDKLQGKKKR